MSLPDIRVTVYNPTMSEIYALDASANIGRSQLKYSDSPDGSNAAATIPLIQTYEDVYAEGYWAAFDIVEISSGDNVLMQNAPLLEGGESQNYYIDSAWGFDSRIWMDDQVAYFWDGDNLTQRCPVNYVGFYDAPNVLYSTQATATGTSLTVGIAVPAAGTAILLFLTSGYGITIGPSGSGWSRLTYGQQGTVQLQVWKKIAVGDENEVVITSSGQPSSLLRATVAEVVNPGTITATADATQSGPLLWSPPSASPGIGGRAICAFATAEGAGATTPRGWTAVSNQPDVQTTLTENVTPSPNLQTITVASSAGLIAGEPAVIGSGSFQEQVTLTAVGTGTIQAVFQNIHLSGAPVVATSAGANQLAVFSAPCTDTSTVGAASSLQGSIGSAAVAITVTIGVPSSATPQPYINCTTSLNGGGTPAYLAYQTTVGRRRYSGIVQRRLRPNSKMPSATITCTGMAEYLNRAVGNFTFTTEQEIDVGTAIFSVLNLFATQWPFFTIDQRNFPEIGQTYDGTWTASQVSSALSSMLKSIATGDGWYIRVGHDFTPRLIPLYRNATDTYLSNVTLQQGSPPQAVAVSVTDEDVTQTYNRILVTGDTDPVSGVAFSAEVVDEASYAFFGVYLDGTPVQVQGLKSTAECAQYGQALLNQNSLAASSNVLTCYTRYNPGAGVTLPGNMLQGDVLPPVAHITATGFVESAGGTTPPDIVGLASVIVTTIECDDTRGTDSYQTASFSAMMPDWRAEIAQQANAVANAFATNSAAAAGIDQYFVDASAYPPSISGFVVTVPSFYAVFASGSAPVLVGGNSFTVPPNTTARAWLSSSNTWDIVTDGSIVTGSIPYLFVQTNAAGIVGSIDIAQIGLLEIPASYLLEGNLTTPTLTGAGGTGSPTITVSNTGQLVSQLTITVECTNQPTDGSLVKAILYYRQAGQPTWLQFATSAPRNATPGADGQGAQLTGAATSADGLYVWIYPEAANGPEFQFGFALESNRGTETAVAAVGTSQVTLGAPSGTTLTLGTPTITVISSGASALAVTISVPYTLSSSQNAWCNAFNIYSGYYDPEVPSQANLVTSITATDPSSTGTLTFGAQLVANSTSAPTYRYYFYASANAINGNLVESATFVYTHA